MIELKEGAGWVKGIKKTTWQADGVCQLTSGFQAGLSY